MRGPARRCGRYERASGRVPGGAPAGQGVWFEYVRSPSFDLNTAQGRRIARTLAAQDAGEAEETAERVARAKVQAAQAGKYSGGPRPYGYEVGGIIVRDSEAKVIKDCVARVIAGESQTAIVRHLNDSGIPTTLGGRWSVANFKQTVARRRYVQTEGHTPGCPAGCDVQHGICCRDDRHQTLHRVIGHAVTERPAVARSEDRQNTPSPALAAVR